MSIVSRAVVAVLFLILASVTIAEAGSPMEDLQFQVHRVLEALANSDLAGPDKADQRRATLFSIAADAFALEQTAKLTLGDQWKSLTAEQRDEFVQVFRRFIERSYLAHVELTGAERVVYTGETIDGDRAFVSSKIVTKQGGETPVEFRMVRAGDHWRLYDISVDGMSLVASYRAQFARVIRTASYEDLVRKLRAKP